MLFLQSPITEVKGVGEATQEKLQKLSILSVKDLLNHLPSRYLDYSMPVNISELNEKSAFAFKAKITNLKSVYTRSHKLLTQAKAVDQTGTITLTWFNNPFIKKLINEDQEYTVAGKPTIFAGKLTIISPIIESSDSISINSKGLVPIYPQTAGINSRLIRKYVYSVLDTSTINDPVDQQTLKELDLLALDLSYKQIHFPKTKNERWQADKRLSFNEHLKINITNQIEQQRLGASPSTKINQSINLQTEKELPFKLTLDQQKTVLDIYKDIQKKTFTHRLIQGDTGSGKTATLLFAAHQALASKHSCAIIAPTEILANQHYSTFKKYSIFKDSIKLITANSHPESINDQPEVYIGTHAVFSQLPTKLKFPLLFIAVDEQHKFGVDQRHALLERAPVPHLINLSATPIPRTVALGLLGEINISSINSAPQDRLTTKTFCLSENKFSESYSWLNKELQNGNQIFVVCPQINDKGGSVASVEKYFKHYQKHFGSKYPVYSVHGKMKSQEQNEAISKFKESKAGILVATSLIEVGIDIPSANIMIIHSADYFGLAQLHQLRGRVGRGGKQGYCFLVSSTEETVEVERLNLLKKHHSGLILAQKDLRIRGAGEVFGTKQHGSLQTRLKYFWSKKLYLQAKKVASKLISENLVKTTMLASELELG